MELLYFEIIIKESLVSLECVYVCTLTLWTRNPLMASIITIYGSINLYRHRLLNASSVGLPIEPILVSTTAIIIIIINVENTQLKLSVKVLLDNYVVD